MPAGWVEEFGALSVCTFAATHDSMSFLSSEVLLQVLPQVGG